MPYPGAQHHFQHQTDMPKVELKKHALVNATPTVVVSAYDEAGNPCACTLAFFMWSSHVPPCVTIAINATARRKTLRSILDSGAFVVGYPSSQQQEQADYLGVETSYNTDKLNNLGWSCTPAKTVNAPIINELKLSLECKVVNVVTIGSHTQITGEVTCMQADDDIVDERGKVVTHALDPIIYDEQDFTYHTVCEKCGDAFKMGAALKKRLNTD